MTEPATTTTPEPTGGDAFDIPGLAALLGDDGEPPAPQTTTADAAAAPTQTNAQATSAEVKTTPAEPTPVDPLAEELYAENVLQTPEQAREAAKLLRTERAKAAELRKKALNAHSQAEKREAKVKRRETELAERETRVSAVERYQAATQADLESGDAERFLTAVARASKSADPASFWKKVSMKLASGGTFTEAEKRQAQADPETQQRLAAIEHGIIQQREREETAYIEHLKTQNLHFAQKSEQHPFLKLYSTEQAANIREALAATMLREARERGAPIDVKTACDILEESLKVQYELSQRVGGKTNGEKETADPGSDAGRETSGQPPKPETATRAPATVPASLTATQGQTQRALSPREVRTQQVQSLPATFWSQFGLE
jgi:hypothetical protein